jgi:hypothetical protein
VLVSHPGLDVLRFVGNQILTACEEVNIEKALFWVKWTLEEEIKVRKENGGGLTSSAVKKAVRALYLSFTLTLAM